MTPQPLLASTVIRQDLENHLTQVAEDLVRTYDRSSADGPGLIFPEYRGGALRVCEQEAKVLLLCRLLSNPRYRVSIEKPTSLDYSFTGSGSRSAQTDVAIYDRAQDTHVLMEFKAGNGATGITKDIEKLVREHRLGVWFHTLAAADSGTLPSLARKFQASVGDLRHYLEDAEPHDCLFAFCILRSRVFLSRWLPIGGIGAPEALEAAFAELSVNAPSWSVRHLSAAPSATPPVDLVEQPSVCED